MRARWYDPEVGRFLSEDPIGLAGGINLYAFAGGDPIHGFDPTGELSLKGFYRIVPVVAFVMISWASNGTWPAMAGALKALGAAAFGSGVSAGVQSLTTGASFEDAFWRNFGVSSLFLGGGATISLVRGGLVAAGNNGLFQGFIHSRNPIGLRGGLTLGSGAVFSGGRGLSALVTETGPSLAQHEFGHTVQFLALSHIAGNVGGRYAEWGPWMVYLGLGAVGTQPWGCWWEQTADYLGSGGGVGPCPRK